MGLMYLFYGKVTHLSNSFLRVIIVWLGDTGCKKELLGKRILVKYQTASLWPQASAFLAIFVYNQHL